MKKVFYDNEQSLDLIIEAILNLIKKYQTDLLCKRDLQPALNLSRGMPSLHNLNYMICEIYDNNKKLVTKVLQFTTWNSNKVADNGTIYVSLGDEVWIDEDLITVIQREDDGSFNESILRIFPSHKVPV
jgi:hypothetical protein